MTIDVLITTMNNEDIYGLLSNMNIKTNALVGNQTNYNKINEIIWNNNLIQIMNFNERGVGLNRNNLLMRSKADICILGDDDMEFKSNYKEIVSDIFQKNADADVIIFNIDEDITTRYVTKKNFQVNYFNFFRFGAARIAFRRKPILFNAIYFNQLFGGGCKYSHGEDTLFLLTCLKAHLKIIAITESIARLKPSSSSWFNGYTKKYFNDQGVLFFAISKKYYKLLCFQDVIRHKREYGNNIGENYSLMIKGAKDVKKKNL